MKRIISLITVITLLVTMVSGISVMANDEANAAAEYKKTIFEENFEGETYSSPITCFDCNASSKLAELTTETNGNKYMALTYGWDAAAFEFDPITTSKFEIDFDFYYDADMALFAGYQNSGDTFAKQTILWVDNSGKAFFNGDSTTHTNIMNGESQTTLTKNNWYSYHAVLDDSTTSINIEIKDANGDIVGTATKTEIARKTGIAWPGWVQSGTEFKQLIAMFNANLDNIEIKEVHNAPTVSGVEFYDAEGSKLGDSLKRVRKINVLFDEQMNEDTFTAETVKLTNESGAVAYSGTLSADGKTYQMAMDKKLSAGDYTLSVNNVKSELGAAIAAEYTKTFTVAGTSNIVFKENFEGETYATPKTVLNADGYPHTPELTTETNGNRYMAFENNWGAMAYEFEPIKTSKFEIAFDFYYDAGVAVFAGWQNGGDLSTKQTILWVGGDNVVKFNGDGGTFETVTSNGSNTTLEKEKWYSYHAVLDDSTTSIDIEITDKETGSVLGTASKSGLARKNGNAWYGWVQSGNEFKQLIAMFNANLDNIVIKEVASAPVVKTASIKTADGTVQSDKEAVSILADRIVVDFGEPMDTDTLKTAVTLVKKGENGAADKNIALKSSVSKNVYTGEFSGLEKNSTYEFKISTDAKTIYEIALAEAYNMTFKTQTAQLKAELESVKIGDNAVTNLADLQDGAANVNLSVLNSLDNGVATVLIIAYYNDGEMLGIKAYDVGINVGDSGTKTVPVQIAKPENTSKVKIMLWENFRTMEPLSDSMEF